MSVGSPTAGTWSSSQWRPDNEFETDTRRLRRRRGRLGDTWYLDEVFVKIQGRLHYLWRAVDEDGDVIDILVQSRRNRPFPHLGCSYDRRLTRAETTVSSTSSLKERKLDCTWKTVRLDARFL